jgi:DNA-binding Lrp family transcriptional regulator
MLVARNVGRWDATVAAISTGHSGLSDLLLALTRNIGGHISERVITTEVECHYSSLRLIAPAKTIVKEVLPSRIAVKADDIDRKLLTYLAANCRTPLSQLAEEFELTPSAIQRRIARLEKSGLIIGYRVKIDYDLIGFNQFRVFIMLRDTSPEIFKKVSSMLIDTGRVESVSRYIGYADIDFRCYASSLANLSDFLTLVRDQFIDEIAQVEVVPIFLWRTINYFPLITE